jgi:transposase
VREFVQQTYANRGRPSIDPIVFFKRQLVMFFEGIRSERQLMRHAADRLSVLWYLGYDLGEPLPDHSSLTRIRERYGVDVFRRFFDAIVEQCKLEKLVWGEELYIDSTQVNDNADLDSLTPNHAGPSPLLMNLVIEVLFKNPPLNLVGSPALLEASQRLSASSKVAKGHHAWRGLHYHYQICGKNSLHPIGCRE